MNTTSPSLLERLRQPAGADWDRFVQLYTPLLCLWARRLGVTGPDAEDLVQEVLTVLVHKLPEFRYDPRQRFRGWLWTILVNKVRTGRRQAPAEAFTHQALDRLAGPDEVAALVEEEYRDFVVRQALALMRSEFQPATWQAFQACVGGERSPAEVAAELGLSVPAVYAAKSRVLRRLRQELDGLLD